MADDTVRDCVRCSALTVRGIRCKRNTCKYTKYCFQHAWKKEGVKIKKSKIPGAGDGLFAAKDFKAGETVADYGGEIINAAEHNRRNGNYSLQISRNKFIDGRSTQSGLGRWVNDCRAVTRRGGHCRRNNAKLQVHARSRRGRVRATRRIRAGQEIYAGYGRAYWSDTQRGGGGAHRGNRAFKRGPRARLSNRAFKRGTAASSSSSSSRVGFKAAFDRAVASEKDRLRYMDPETRGTLDKKGILRGLEDTYGNDPAFIRFRKKHFPFPREKRPHK